MKHDENIDQLARIIWEYHHMHQSLKKADALFVLCSHDLRVAEYAATLFFEDYAPLLIFSGGMAHSEDLLTTGWDKSEAEIFADIAIKNGVPPEKIISEKKATNTGENISFTRALLKEKNLDPNSFILVQKPYMERRTYATFMKQWPDKNFLVTSPSLSYQEYMQGEISKETIINIMVGDLQRIKEYPALGYQIFQKIPSEVQEAYDKLVLLGFDRHLMKVE